MAEQKEIRFKIDGKEVVAKPGETVIQVAHRYGINIPHYCYHPGLPIDGNCRMCLAKFAAPRGDKVVPFPKPMTTCTTYPTEGMEVDVSSDEAQKLRQEIMEFLLINHPLDCPICDQAGECALQDYAYKYGRPKGRFKEEKVHKHKKNLGKYIAIWGERCIVCKRCIRFLDHISGTSELCVIERGDRSVIDVFDENHPVDNPLSLNVVDICPVGALLSRDFLYSQRSWFLKSKHSVCAACSKGCNIIIDYDLQKIRRIRTQPNPDVNDFWMCDEGRMFFKHTHSDKRIDKAYIRGEKGLEEKPNHLVWQGIVEALQKSREEKKGIGLLGSLYHTCEAMYLLKKLADKLGTQYMGALEKEVQEDQVFPGFVIEGDKNPNRKGWEAVFGKETLEKGLDEVIKAVSEGNIQTLLVANAIPDFKPSSELLEALEKVETLIVIDILENEITQKAHFLLGGSTYTEENGIFVHSKGKWQKLGAVMFPPGRAEQNHKILQRILSGLEGKSEEPVRQKLVREEMMEKLEAFKKIEQENFYPHLHNLPVGTIFDENQFSPAVERRV